MLLKSLFAAAIAAADPALRVPPYLPSAPRGRTIVVGAGKACQQRMHHERVVGVCGVDHRVEDRRVERIADVLYVLVALIWLVPDRRIERRINTPNST